MIFPGDLRDGEEFADQTVEGEGRRLPAKGQHLQRLGAGKERSSFEELRHGGEAEVRITAVDQGSRGAGGGAGRVLALQLYAQGKGEPLGA